METSRTSGHYCSFKAFCWIISKLILAVQLKQHQTHNIPQLYAICRWMATGTWIGWAYSCPGFICDADLKVKMCVVDRKASEDCVTDGGSLTVDIQSTRGGHRSHTDLETWWHPLAWRRPQLPLCPGTLDRRPVARQGCYRQRPCWCWSTAG